MNREIAIAAFCLLITIGVGWLVDHPNKVAGTIILLVAFGIVVVVARARHSGRSSKPKFFRNPPSDKRS